MSKLRWRYRKGKRHHDVDRSERGDVFTEPDIRCGGVYRFVAYLGQKAEERRYGGVSEGKQGMSRRRPLFAICSNWLYIANLMRSKPPIFYISYWHITCYVVSCNCSITGVRLGICERKLCKWKAVCKFAPFHVANRISRFESRSEWVGFFT